MLAVMIMAMMAGALFGIIQAGVSVTGDLGYLQRRSQELASLDSLLRKTFRSLPADAIIRTEPGGIAGGFPNQLLIHNAGNTLSWGSHSIGETDVLISPRQQIGGRYTLSVFHLDSEQVARGNVDLSKALKQVDLVSDLKKIQWRVLHLKKWFDRWNAGAAKPDLIELTLYPAEEPNPKRMVFWLPKLVLPPAVPSGQRPPIERGGPQGGEEPLTISMDGNPARGAPDSRRQPLP